MYIPSVPTIQHGPVVYLYSYFLLFPVILICSVDKVLILIILHFVLCEDVKRDRGELFVLSLVLKLVHQLYEVVFKKKRKEKRGIVCIKTEGGHSSKLC